MTNLDRRALAIGLGGGLCCALLAFVSDFPPITRIYDAAIPIDIFTLRLHHFIHFAAMLLGFLVLPFRVSSVARQRYFLWGGLPIVLTYTGFLAATCQNAPIFRQNVAEFPVLAVFWFVFSGPLSLKRWLAGRKGKREEREVQELAETWAAQKENVWPPPPQR